MTPRMMKELALCFAVALAVPLLPTSVASAAPAPASTTSWPSVGDRGDDVRRLQQALILAGVGVAGGVDGVFGSATSASVRRYQKALGLEASGELDSATSAALGLGLPAPGDRGPAVTRLQKLLMAAHLDVFGGADGFYGAATAEAVSSFQAALGRERTGKLDHSTAYLLGFTPQPKSVAPRSTASSSTSSSSSSSSWVAIEVFPVQGHCGYRDGWLGARPGGRRHVGVDIIAPEGNYVYAVVDGIITDRMWDYAGRMSGNALKLATLDGSNTYFFYGHLFDFVPGIKKGTRVKAGQIIGFVGDTGLAGTSHLHFEVHPGGGKPVNPYPIVRAVDACDDTTPGPNAYG